MIAAGAAKRRLVAAAASAACLGACLAACSTSPPPALPELVADPPRTAQPPPPAPPPPRCPPAVPQRAVPPLPCTGDAACTEVDALTAVRRMHEVQRDHVEALALLDVYGRRFPHGVLAPEAAILRREAARWASPSSPEEVVVPVRTLRYREVYVGNGPGETLVTTWTLVLGENGRARLSNVRRRAGDLSLVAGCGEPVGTRSFEREGVRLGSESSTGGWRTLDKSGGIAFDLGGMSHHCSPESVLALEPGAELVLGKDAHGGRTAAWRPPERTKVEVLRCDRRKEWVELFWDDEPQPHDVLLADLPGLEYAHDDDTAVRKGALRRMAAAP